MTSNRLEGELLLLRTASQILKSHGHGRASGEVDAAIKEIRERFESS